MTKKDLLTAVIKTGSFATARDAQEAVDALLEIIKETLENGEEVKISGFGKWEVRNKEERLGRNPQTGEPMTLKPRKVVTFKCSNSMKNGVA